VKCHFNVAFYNSIAVSTDRVAWSVGVWVCVGHVRMSPAKRLNRSRFSLKAESCEPKEPFIRDSDLPMKRGDFGGYPAMEKHLDSVALWNHSILNSGTICDAVFC